MAHLQGDTTSYKGYFRSLRAVFGPVLKSNKPLRLVNAQPSEACGQSSYTAQSVLTNRADCVGNAVIIDRGTCYFVDKVQSLLYELVCFCNIAVLGFSVSGVERGAPVHAEARDGLC